MLACLGANAAEHDAVRTADAVEFEFEGTVAASGYEFDSAKQRLEELSGSLELTILAQMRTALSSWHPPTSVEALQSQLASTIPAIISVAYDPNGTHNALVATARDIGDKVRR